jgi:iron complex transport system substrate-binding protein
MKERSHMPAKLMISIIFLFSALGFLTAAGGEPEATGHIIGITDALGREVAFEAYPKRVLLAGKAVVFSTNTIYLFPSATRLVVGTGVTDQGLGDFYPIVDPKAGEKLRYANNAGPEQLITAKPDVVILKHYLRQSLGVSIEELGIPVVYFNAETPETFYSDVTMFGTLLNDERRGQEIIDYYQSTHSSIIEKTKKTARPRVLLVSYSKRDGESAFSVPSSGWLQTRIVEDGGGTAVWKGENSGGGWKKINIEQAAVWNPEYIFVVSYNTPAEVVVNDISSSLSLGMLNAEILPFPADFYSWDQPDPRWILGILWTAKVLHPDLFAGIDLADEIRYFYSFLYGLDDRSIEKEIIPRIVASLPGAR